MKHYSVEIKREDVRLHLEKGITTHEIMERLGIISERRVTLWCEKYRKEGELALHSDQGFQYTSHAYFRLTQDYDITPSMSRRGNCLDNACMENFFGMLKTEWIQRRKFASMGEAREAVEQYIHYYNYERCQLKTRLTPFQKRCQPA